MTIGEALEFERKKLNLTEKEMTNGIISIASYSRVERNLQDIKARDLFAILDANRISMVQFVHDLDIDLDEKDTEAGKWRYHLDCAFYENNIQDMEIINQVIQEKSKSKELKLSGNIVLAKLKNNLDCLSTVSMDELDVLCDSNWVKDLNLLKLFYDVMPILSMPYLSARIKEILTEYSGREKQIDPEYQYVLGMISISYARECSFRGDYRLMEEIFIFLDKLPRTPKLFLIKLLEKYYVAILLHDKAKSKHISKILRKMGYQKIATDIEV